MLCGPGGVGAGRLVHPPPTDLEVLEGVRLHTDLEVLEGVRLHADLEVLEGVRLHTDLEVLEGVRLHTDLVHLDLDVHLEVTDGRGSPRRVLRRLVSQRNPAR